jgi:hypothetical protein
LQRSHSSIVAAPLRLMHPWHATSACRSPAAPPGAAAAAVSSTGKVCRCWSAVLPLSWLYSPHSVILTTL